MSVEELLEGIKQLTVVDLAKLVKAIEDEFGVSAAAPVAVAAAPAGDGAAVEEAEEQTEFDVHLTEIGSQKIKVIKEVRAFTGLGLREANAEFLADLLGDRVAGNRDRASKETVAIRKQEIGAPPADVEDHRAVLVTDVVGPGGVVTGCGRNVNSDGLQPNRLDSAGHLLDDLVLDHDEHHVHFLGFRIGDQLVIPDDLFHRKRNILPRLELHDLSYTTLFLRDRGELNKTGEGRLAGDREHTAAGGEVVLNEHLAQKTGDDDGAGTLGEFLLILPLGEANKGYPFLGVLELANLDACSTNVDGQYSVYTRHVEVSAKGSLEDAVEGPFHQRRGLRCS